MKKLFIVAVIMMASVAQTFAGPVITIRIEIGRLSQGCTGFSFCHGSIGATKSTSSTNETSTAQIDENKNALIVNLSSATVAGKEDYLRGSTVTFEEAFEIPSDIQRALGSKNKITIAAGKYKLLKTATGYQITVPLN